MKPPAAPAAPPPFAPRPAAALPSCAASPTRRVTSAGRWGRVAARRDPGRDLSGCCGPPLAGERLAEFLQLRGDHEHAIALGRVVPEILLVIVLGTIVRRRRRDLGDDVPLPGRARLRNRIQGDALLLGVVIEND